MATPMDRFPALVSPVQDMAAVRDRRRTGVLSVDVDLSTARSLAGGNALVLPLNGTIIYIDQRENTGFANVHVQDETFNIANTPVTVFAGFILRAPFTQLTITNPAQAGRSLRILYGVDIDFIPGSGAGVTVVNPVNVLDEIEAVCQHVENYPGFALGVTISPVFLPAANPNGVRLRHVTQMVAAGAGGTLTQQLIARPTAPVGLGAANPGVELAFIFNNATTIAQFQDSLTRQIPAGWGVWVASNVTVAAPTVNSCFLSYEVQ